ncbi:unnamed protein product [Adineta ricciae]|uniref:Uncharacterized protein n=1 Tax=Adineta ricciae TaxID=249248 RepID=A0A814LFS0_ADIRI|nr:unnamed protein product [Adineta ricciae]
MATRQPNQTRPVKQSTVQKPPTQTQTRKPASQQSTPRQAPARPAQSRPPVSRPAAPAPGPAPVSIPSTPVIHHPTDVKTGNEHHQQQQQQQQHQPPPAPAQHTTEKTTTITTTTTTAKDATEKPYLDYLNDYVVDWKEPINLEPIKSPRFSNAGRLSPRLRPIGTPPSLVTYQNRHNLRQGSSTLPALPSTLFTTGAVDTFGLDPPDYRYADNLRSYGRKPSPLSNIKYTSEFYRPTQTFGMETHMNLPPLSMSTGGNSVFASPSHRLTLINAPHSRYRDFDRLDTFIAPGLRQEPSNLDFVPHEAFTNHYVEDFIGHCIEDQFVPDILHETINELGLEVASAKRRSPEIHRHVVDPFRVDTDKYIDDERNRTHLYSDDWVRELGLKSRPRLPTPASDYESHAPSGRRIEFKEAPPIRTHTAPLRFHEMMPDAQNHLITTLNQELIDHELDDLLRDLSRNIIADRANDVPVLNDDIYYKPIIPQETRRETPKRLRDQGQYKTIENYAGNNLMDTICLDNLIQRYINQTDSAVDYDDTRSRLLDGTMLDNLIHHYSARDEYRY